MTKKIILYTDGGSRGNPGPGATASILKNAEGETINEIGLFIGTATNNDAEYKALITGLENCKKLEATEVSCFLDSELVVKQLNGTYKVKSETIKTYYLKIKNLEKDFSKVSYTHIPREKNKEADALVNKVLDSVDD